MFQFSKKPNRDYPYIDYKEIEIDLTQNAGENVARFKVPAGNYYAVDRINVFVIESEAVVSEEYTLSYNIVDNAMGKTIGDSCPIELTSGGVTPFSSVGLIPIPKTNRIYVPDSVILIPFNVDTEDYGPGKSLTVQISIYGRMLPDEFKADWMIQ